MAATRTITAREVLATLERLSDDELHMVIGRAQGLLLDRPIPPNIMPALAVEVVGHEESRLLAAYRTLAPLAQRRLLGHVVHLVRASRRLGHRQKPAAAVTMAGSLLSRHSHTIAP